MFQSDFSELDPAGQLISLTPSYTLSVISSLPVAVYKLFILFYTIYILYCKYAHFVKSMSCERHGYNIQADYR